MADPIPDQFRAQMNAVGQAIDEFFNGERRIAHFREASG